MLQHGSFMRVLTPVIFVLCLAAGMASAQPAMPSPSRAMVPPKSLTDKVGIDQNLGAQVPLDLKFRDESGQTVELSKYIHDKPVILTLVYYGCPSLCTMTLNGVAKSLKPISFDVGKEFEVVTVSFDPSEKPELAAEKKASYIKLYGRENAAAGWHFLTGDQPSIDALTKAVGFRYTYDEASQQFAHTTALILLTPEGKISRYFYGLEYSPRDIRLGLIEAADNKIGTISDVVLLMCYQYDPAKGKYGVAVFAVLRIMAVLTLAALGTFMFVMFRRERRMAPATAAAATKPPNEPPAQA